MLPYSVDDISKYYKEDKRKTIETCITYIPDSLFLNMNVKVLFVLVFYLVII